MRIRTVTLGIFAALTVAAPLALSTGSANAAAPKLNHGQCVSSSVHAGITGAAHEAIAQNNSLVGEYGTSTCPLVVPVAPPKADIGVQAPVFGYDSHTCSVTVPYTKGIGTRLYGVNGYPQENPITGDVTVTAGLDGAIGPAPQFWIGYTAKPGYVLTGTGTAHVDFYNGDYIADCETGNGVADKASSDDLAWSVDLSNYGYDGVVTGTTRFDADAAGGTLDYSNVLGWNLHATVDAGTYVKTGNTATFRGTITSTNAYGGGGYIVVNVADGGGASGGDKIAVFVNEEPHDNILADVITGNLTIN
jgi:hypothetical protein